MPSTVAHKSPGLWSFPRVAMTGVFVCLLALDLYAMYTGWFGWDRGGMHGSHPSVDNWDDRNMRGVIFAVPLVIGCVFTVWIWPRTIGRLNTDLRAIQRAADDYRRTRSWDAPQ